MYSIEFSKDAEKQFFKLDKGMQERVVSVLERIRVRPHSFVKKLVGNPYFRLRVGKYRAILEIQEDKLIIFVLEIGHRKDIYK
tara:strand:- start:91 stop:339 length:249 start_codon:yes stop_codon:yes gene_type:complete